MHYADYLDRLKWPFVRVWAGFVKNQIHSLDQYPGRRRNLWAAHAHARGVAKEVHPIFQCGVHPFSGRRVVQPNGYVDIEPIVPCLRGQSKTGFMRSVRQLF